jgi:GT2 family glycosyltransferase
MGRRRVMAALPRSLAVDRPPRATVGLLSWNGRRHLEDCLPALAEQEDPAMPWEVTLLDNASSDDTVAWVKSRFPWVRVLESPTNLGFCAGYDRMVREARGEFFALLNDDTRPRADWLRVLLAAIDEAPPDVAAVGGLLVDWDGRKLDFGRGVLTFDGHALQRGSGVELANADAVMPAVGEELPFACGGNMAVRRRSFLDAGGFDPAYFAYFEDVDLGWRLWSRGERVISEPRAVAAHRSSGSSDRLGVFKRGFLFERNALRTAYKNLDQVHFERWMPAVWLTFSSRLQSLLVENNPHGHLATIDPYRQTDPLALGSNGSGNGSAVGVLGRLRRRALRFLRGVPAEAWASQIALSDPRTLAQFRALHSILGNLDELAAARAATQAGRRRTDAEFFARFPLHVVPTYPGDHRLFQSPGFRSLLPPEGWVTGSLEAVASGQPMAHERVVSRS